jgi:glycosyltransferase involved in cell wall biosynthesis
LKLIFDAVGIRGGGAFSILDDLLITFPLVDNNIQIQLYVIPSKFRDYEIKGYNFQNIKFKEVKISRYYIGRLIWQNLLLPFLFYKNSFDHLFSFYNYGSYFIPRQTIYFHQPVIFDLPLYKGKKKIKYIVIRLMSFLSFRFASNIIVQTRDFKKKISQVNKFLEEKISVIPGGYHYLINNNPENKPDLVFNRIIYIAHPFLHKNFNVLIEAMSILNKGEGKKMKLGLTLHNDASLYSRKADCQETERLIELAKKLNVYECIEWMGVLGKSEVMKELQISDMLVFPSLCESFGLPLVEAISVNKPIVAADLPYARDVAKDCAIYFDPHSPEDLAEKILLLYNDKSLRDTLSLNCEKYKEIYSYMNISREIISLFK